MMRSHPGDTIKENISASTTQELKERLRMMDPDQILDELKERTAVANANGEELDPQVILLYYDILDELSPIEVPQGALTRSIGRFTHEHPEFVEEEHKQAQRTPVRKLYLTLSNHRLAAAMLTLVLLVTLTTVAVAFDIPQKIIVWGQDVFQLRSGCGEMRLETPTDNGYLSLEEALSSYGVYTYTPTWMPENIKLDDVIVSDNELWITFYAIYVSKDTLSDYGTVKIMVFNNSNDVPSVQYEDGGEGSRHTMTVGDMDIVVSENEGDHRAAWDYKNSTGVVYGGFSESEIERIAKSLKLEEN